MTKRNSTLSQTSIGMKYAGQQSQHPSNVNKQYFFAMAAVGNSMT